MVLLSGDTPDTAPKIAIIEMYDFFVVLIIANLFGKCYSEHAKKGGSL